jgi:hypothetical protein
VNREQLFEYLRDKFEPFEVVEMLQDSEEIDNDEIMDSIIDILGDRIEEYQELFLDEYFANEEED